jgi:type I restriction enzyme, S subunit
LKTASLLSNWRTATLKEVASDKPNAIVDGPFGSNLKSDDYVGSGVPVLQGKNITNDEFRWFDVRYISERKAGELKRSSVRVNDILVVKIGSIGYSAIVDSLNGYEFAIIPANLVKVTPNPDIVCTKYLHHWLTSPDAKRYLVANASKTAQPALSLGKIKELPVPLPPLPEQRRIAAILDQADALRAKRREALAQLDSLTQSIFIEMFGDPVRNPLGWPMMSFENVCKTRLGKMLDQKQQTGTHSRKYLRNANVQWFRFDLSEVFEMDFDDGARETFRLQDGDLLICEGGEPGRAAIWREEISECYYQKALHRGRVDAKLATPEYVARLLWFFAKHGGLSDHVTSATIAHLTGEKLKAMQIPLPTLALQKKFCSRVNQITSIKSQQQQSLANLDALFASLQHRAFHGEL